MHRALRDFGVDDVFVTAVPGLPTPVTFCEVFPPDHFPIWFYRYPKAPDLEIRPEEIPAAEVRGARLFWATVTGLSAEPSRAAHFAAWQARDPLTLQAGRVAPGVRDEIDAEVEDTLDEAVRFALAGRKPEPADAREYLYASGLRTRPGVAARSAERPMERTLPR